MSCRVICSHPYRSFWVILCLGLLGPSTVLGQDYRPMVGQPYPDLVLPKIDDGTPLSLSSFRGKKVLLIHFASW